MTNTRFRELAPGMEVELIATQIQFKYTPNGLTTPEALTATWWAQEYLPIGTGYQAIGDQGYRMETNLAQHATKTLTVLDPVLGQEVTLSAIGAVQWLKAWFDFQHNLEHQPHEVPAEPEPPAPDPVPEPDPVGE